MTSMTSPDAASTEMVSITSRSLAEATLASGSTFAVYIALSVSSASVHWKTVRICAGVPRAPRPSRNIILISKC